MKPAIFSLRFAWCFLPLMTPVAWGSGIFIDSQNAVGVGNANAGASALAEDASTVFFNPAGMSALGDGQLFSGTLTLAQVDSTFKDEGSTPLNALVPLGDSRTEISRDAVVPSLFYVAGLSDNLHVGLGVSPTFGNEGKWDDDFAGRYQGSDTTIEGVNYNPSLSLQLDPQIALGFGVNYMHLDAELISKTPLVAGGAYRGDGVLTMEGKDGGWGYNVGLLVQATPATKIGVTYRSTIKLDVKGSVSVEAPSVRVQIPGELRIELPDMASLGVVHQIDEQWDFLADLSWFGWSTVHDITVRRRPDGVILQSDILRFDNGVRAGLGLTWRMSPAWTLRSGIALDTTVADQPEYLSVRFPDNDRKWVALGASYKLSSAASLDLGYSHGFVDDADINRVTPLNNAPTAQTIKGTFSSAADLFALQWNQRF